ncbi:thymidylate synthase [Candidatus Pacearchaeota archaeon RBG_16_35_8]|nr:MAG: thymidylate synthase [Candidatus Pacearchaeota archaeon RBG_16_35_8]
MVEQYLEHARTILTHPLSGLKPGSKGAYLLSLPGYMASYDLREGFPLITTKKMFTKGVIEELLWFFKGDSNIKYLENKNVSIWTLNAFQFNFPKMAEKGIFPEYLGTEDAKYTPEWEAAVKEFGRKIREEPGFAEEFGDAGRIYPIQWRKWSHYNPRTGKLETIDQLGDVIKGMQKKPFGKKYMVTAWNPGEIDQMSQPSCHVIYHLMINEDEKTGERVLDLSMTQRSSDMFLGVPFNIASYALLTHIIADQVGVKPRRFVHTLDDSHFYTGLGERSKWYVEHWRELKNKVREVRDKPGYLEVLEWVNKNAPAAETEGRWDHVTAILEQLSREPLPMPQLSMVQRKTLEELTVDDFKITGYEHHPLIRREMHV